MSNIIPLIFPLYMEPIKGRKIRVILKDGTELLANCTLIIEGKHEYLMYYDNKTRKGIPINKMKGWCYV